MSHSEHVYPWVLVRWQSHCHTVAEEVVESRSWKGRSALLVISCQSVFSVPPEHQGAAAVPAEGISGHRTAFGLPLLD